MPTYTKPDTKPTIYQEKVKGAQIIRYRGQYKNCDEQFARDVITLYVTCKLGLAPIRRVLGQKSEKKIDGIRRQHGLGRKNMLAGDNEDTKLDCPSSKTISQLDVQIIRSIAAQYGTLDDPYVANMLRTGRWKNENRTRVTRCKCGHTWSEDDVFCPKCGTRRNPAVPKALAQIGDDKE